MMYCANCGREIPADSAFCPSCGADQYKRDYSYPVVQNRLCPNCGREIQADFAFCPSCGADQTRRSYTYCSPAQPVVQKQLYNTACIVGFTISIISLFLNFLGIVGIAGTIVSVFGLSSCGHKNEKGRALAIIGIVIGAYSILYGVIALLSFSV